MKTISIYVALITINLVSLPLFAHNNNQSQPVELIDQLQLCKNTQADNLRLACFDKILNAPVASLRSNLLDKNYDKTHNKTFDRNIPNDVTSLKNTSLTTPTAIKTDPVEEEKKKAVDNFAKEHLQKTEQEQAQNLTEISATIEKIDKLIRGQYVIYLSNGQKWQQNDSARIRLKVGDTVVLSKAALGAIHLKKKNTNRTINVKRIK